jgi:hypothetical protein
MRRVASGVERCHDSQMTLGWVTAGKDVAGVFNIPTRDRDTLRFYTDRLA